MADEECPICEANLPKGRSVAGVVRMPDGSERKVTMVLSDKMLARIEAAMPLLKGYSMSVKVK